MTQTTWGDLDARARGLGTHLLTRQQMDALTAARDLTELADGMRAAGLPADDAVASAAGLELAARRAAAAALRVLAGWVGARASVLAVVFEDEDRRSLRALARGAAQHAAPEARMSGLVPTPSLPERALAELSRQPSVAAVAALLAAWGDPYAAALRDVAAAAHPDLLKIELAVNRTFAARALAAARRGRSGELVAYVRETTDLENAAAALILAGQGKDIVPKEVFLAGGARVDIGVFERAVATGDAVAAARLLGAALAPARVAQAFGGDAAGIASIEGTLLRLRIADLHAARRRSPLGPAPLLEYALRLRAQVLDLRRIIWSVALAAPRPELLAALVTA
jgi:vacuolar-type H+-ATPase subunit C/Vma6